MTVPANYGTEYRPTINTNMSNGMLTIQNKAIQV